MKPDSLFTSQRAFQAAKSLYLIWNWLHSDQRAGECPRYHGSAVKTKLKQEKQLIFVQCVLCPFYSRSISLNVKSIKRLLISSPIIEIGWAYLKCSLSLSLDAEGLPLIKTENSAAWRLLRYRRHLSGLSGFQSSTRSFPSILLPANVLECSAERSGRFSRDDL